MSESTHGGRWVDEVEGGVPYVMDDAYLRSLLSRLRIDLVVHGDDPCLVDGKDVYASAQALGKYATIPRTEGVSTSEITARMLPLSAAPPHSGEKRALDTALPPSSPPPASSPPPLPSFPRQSNFMTTSRTLQLFRDGCPPPPHSARVVYVCGGWDLLHAGHVALLEAASRLGDFLLVGVLSDESERYTHGAHRPILSLNERLLSVLSCRYTGDVLIAPPRTITREMIASLNIATVVRGVGGVRAPTGEKGDPYTVPKRLGIYKEIESKLPQLTVDQIISRVQVGASPARLLPQLRSDGCCGGAGES